jgi:arylsulfatase A-like enzyme
MQIRPDIIFLMLDTLRFDILKTYGGPLRSSNIDALARKGKVYHNAISPGTYTLTSHTSIFTGRRVRKIKSLNVDALKHHEKNTDPMVSKVQYISDRDHTLARHLSYLGYDTILFSNNPFITNTTGLSSGFSYVKNVFIENKINAHKATLGLVGNDTMRKGLTKLSYYLSLMMTKKQLDGTYIRLRERLNKEYGDAYGFNELDQGAKLTNDLIKKMNFENDSGKFLFVNYMEAHEGYPTNMITDRFVSQDKWLYVGGILDPNDVGIIQKAYLKRIAYLDSKVGELLDSLKSKGMLDNAIVVITSDHGQAFMEHGQLYHTLFPYSELSHVPLIACRFVNGKQVNTGERINNRVSLTNLYDSILDVAYGKEEMINGSMLKDDFVFSDHTGISEVWDVGLLEMLRKRSEYARKVYQTKLRFNTPATAVYHGDYKLIHYYGKLPDELYNLSEDPKENDNVIGLNKNIAREMLNANKLN